MIARARLVGLLCLALASLLACGVKGDPAPPDLVSEREAR